MVTFYKKQFKWGKAYNAHFHTSFCELLIKFEFRLFWFFEEKNSGTGDKVVLRLPYNLNQGTLGHP